MRKQKEKKQPFGITEEFVADVNSASPEQKKMMIVNIQKGMDEAQEFLKNNTSVQDARNELKMLEGPSKDTIKSLKNRTKFILEQLKQSGAI